MGAAGRGRRKLGKPGPPARKGLTAANRKPAKKTPAKKAARKAATKTVPTGRDQLAAEPKSGISRTEPKRGGRKPFAEQKSAIKKSSPAKAAAKRVVKAAVKRVAKAAAKRVTRPAAKKSARR